MRLTLPHGTLDYDDIGTGTPVLLIHGFPLDRSLWRAQIEGLQTTARLIAPDLRGFGQSSDPGDTISMDEYAADLKGLVDSIDLGPVVLCGLSMGGYVAMAFLARYPDAVKGLVLANTRAGADNEQAREGRYATAEKVEAEGASVIADALLPKMLTDATRTDRLGLTNTVKEMMARQGRRGVAAGLRGMAERPDRSDWISSITVPTLIITAAQDTLIPPEEAETMAQAIVGSTLVVIPDAAHLSCIENPDAFNIAIREFLAGLTD